MDKIKSLADLKKKRDELQSILSLREKGDSIASMIQIKVSMATCGIASGAKEVMDVLIQACEKHNLPAVVTQTGCMGYCYAEPTIEIKKPETDPITFGYVTLQKAEEIISKYVLNNEIAEGVIPVNYESIDNKN
jgi:NADP-reducing hydrogenase subunit HndB